MSSKTELINWLKTQQRYAFQILVDYESANFPLDPTQMFDPDFKDPIPENHQAPIDQVLYEIYDYGDLIYDTNDPKEFIDELNFLRLNS